MSYWITVPYWWHATLLEVLWLVGGVIAAAITIANLLDTWKDNQALAQIKAEPAMHDRHYRMIELAAKGRMSSQWTRLMISGLIVATGGFACLNANPLGGHTTWTGFVVTGCLVGISFLNAWKAFADLSQRNRMYELATGRSAVLAARLRARHLDPPS